jgi:hypothetical protein
VVYAESQGGELHRFHLGSGATKGLRPEPNEGQPGFRFHWNAPLIGSVHEPGVLYLGGNRVFRFSEQGERWSTISPDLSANITERLAATGSGAETYGIRLFARRIAREEGDALGRDGRREALGHGERREGLGRPHAGSSPGSEGRVALSRRGRAQGPRNRLPRRRRAPFRELRPAGVANGGSRRSWTSISGNLPVDQPVKVVREDPANPNVLYAGTEFSLFLSVDRGRAGRSSVVSDGRRRRHPDPPTRAGPGDRHPWPQPVRDRRRDADRGADGGDEAEGGPPVPGEEGVGPISAAGVRGVVRPRRSSAARILPTGRCSRTGSRKADPIPSRSRSRTLKARPSPT